MGDSFEYVYGKMSPTEFLEHICCSNYGKFTLHTGDGKTNKDYAGNKEVLAYCHKYVKADLDVLNPDIVIMPKGMYFDGKQRKKFFDQHSEIIVFPVYQINARVVNCTIHGNVNKDKRGPKIPRYEEVDLKTLTENERKWHENIK